MARGHEPTQFKKGHYAKREAWKNKGGRPLKDISPKMVEELANIQCTLKEMAAVLDCSEDLLERRFKDVIAEGKERGKKSLRRKQWEKAMEGSVPMLQWLGRHALGQKEEDKGPTREQEAKNMFKDLMKAAHELVEMESKKSQT